MARAVVAHPPDRPVALGPTPCRLVGLATRPGESPWAGTTSFQALLDQAENGSERIELRLTSPAVFRSRGVRNVLFPEPGLVFGSLLDKWNAFCPPDLRLTLDKATFGERLVVEAHRLATQRVAFGAYAETGVIGWCAYRFAPSVGRTEQCALRALAGFAYYAGIGAKTTMGLGQVGAPAEPPGDHG